MTVQHKDISDSERHEPKGASSAASGTVWKANGVGSGSFSRINEMDIDYSVKANNKFGWNDIADSQYTSGSPRAIASATRTQITNNALATQTDTTRLGGLWLPASNKFVINDLNASYVLRIAFKCTAAAAAGTPYVVLTEVESATGPTVIAATSQVIKGGGYVNHITSTQLMYNGSFINNADLKLFVTADTPINIYDIGFVIQRIYKET